jgi:hypothetical protein
VSSIWFLLPFVQRAGCNWGPRWVTASSCRVFKAALLFARPQLCCPTAATLSGSSHRTMGQFSFEYCLQSQETISRIHHQPQFGRLACCPTSALSFCLFSHLHSLRVQLLASPPPPILRAGSVSHPTPAISVMLQ